MSLTCATEMPRRSDYLCDMAIETSPKPVPRPIPTDLPYGEVDRVEDVATEALVNGGPLLTTNVIGALILMAFVGILVVWAQRQIASNRPAPHKRRPSTSRALPPRFRPASPNMRKSPNRSTSASPRKPKYPIRNLPVFPESGRLTGKCYVIDGDTIVVQHIKIRLAGIDAPELDRPFGQKSKWEMVKICKGQVITVRLTGERSHDRLVGTCHLPDGTDIGAELIKRGLALDWTMFSGGRYRHLEPPGVRAKLRWAQHRSR